MSAWMRPVAALDAGAGVTVQQHVELANGPGASVDFLAQQAEVDVLHLVLRGLAFGVAPHMARTPQKEAAAAHGGIEDTHALFGLDEPDHQTDDLRRGEELPALGACAFRELLDQVLIRAAEDVHVGQVFVGEVQVGEVLIELLQADALAALVSQLVGVVEVGDGEHVGERGVLALYGAYSLVQGIAQVVLVELRDASP
jgi:hypothetical protein